MRRIILFTIGSIQEYIINSRKTKDLQNASNSISILITTLIKYLREKFNGEVLLPLLELDFDRKNQSAQPPNYFIASYENDTPVGDKLKKAAIEEFSRSFFEKLENLEIEQILISQLQQQLNQALDIYWCDLPFSDKDDKVQVIEELFLQLDALKNTKYFEPINEPEGEKCSLCGVNNAIFYKRSENGLFPYKRQRYYTYNKDESISGASIYDLLEEVQKSNPEYDVKKDIESRDLFVDVDRIDSLENHLKAGECLCGVCFKKRFDESEKILSLSDYALHDWLSKFDPKEIIMKDMSNKYNAQAVYELWNDSKKGNALLSKLKSEYGYDKIPSPPTFYCLYRMDIDDLGKRMGKEEYSPKLSELISSFFTCIKDKHESYRNLKIVYAGGDDLLAIMSLGEGFRFAKLLHKKFNQQIGDSIYPDLTYSQGLFFAHHKSPFAEVLRLSRDKLVELKNRYKDDNPAKNGTVISILTEGYSDQSVFFKNSGTINLFEFEELMDYFQNDSSYFHQVLGKEFINLDNFSTTDEHVYLRMLFTEQKRLMKRSLPDYEGKTEIFDKVERSLMDFMLQNISKKGIELINYFNLFALIKKLNLQKRGDYD